MRTASQNGNGCENSSLHLQENPSLLDGILETIGFRQVLLSFQRLLATSEKLIRKQPVATVALQASKTASFSAAPCAMRPASF